MADQRGDHAASTPCGPAGWALRLRGLVAVIVCLTVFDVTVGLTYPLLALILEERGVSTLTNGLNASMLPLGLVVTAPFIPAVARLLGPWRFAVTCIAVTAGVLALLKIWDSLGAWFALRFILGAVEGGLFAISEVWINELATGRNRGRVIAIYSSVLSLGFASGPLLLPTTGIHGWPPFLVGIGFALAGLVFLLSARRSIPAPPPEAHTSFLAFLPLAPALLVAAFAFGIFDTAVMALLPLYGLRKGLDEATASYLLGALIAGNIALQFPLGWLADKTDRRAVMIACALVALLGALLLPAAIGNLWRWPLVVVLGTASFGVYTLALAELGDRFTGSRLLAGTAALTAMFGLGGILGPALAGAMMERLGPDGLAWTLAATFGALLLIATARRRRH
jgi:MFS family permease